MDGSRRCSLEIIDQWINAMVVRHPINAARIGADQGRFTAAEKWQLIVHTRLIGCEYHCTDRGQRTRAGQL